MFIPKDIPLKTCSDNNCSSCNLVDKVNCHFNIKQLIHFCSISLPSFLIGAAGLYDCSIWWLVLWILILIGFFGFLEIKVMCSHCPHYAEESKSLKCWANYSIPKLWKYKPGPMNNLEKLLFISGLVLVWGLPFFVILFSVQIFYLIVFILTTIGFFLTLRKCFCSICMNFACPLNVVEEKEKDNFFKKNPVIAEAWGKKTDRKDRKNAD